MPSSAIQVEAWFENLPKEWQARAHEIRTLIFEAAPGMHEEWRYSSAPFYRHRSWMCYLSFQNDRLILGFIQGRHLVDPGGLLAHTAHKQIRHFFPSLSTDHFDEGSLRRLLQEAVEVNEQAPRIRNGS